MKLVGVALHASKVGANGENTLVAYHIKGWIATRTRWTRVGGFLCLAIFHVFHDLSVMRRLRSDGCEMTNESTLQRRGWDVGMPNTSTTRIILCTIQR